MRKFLSILMLVCLLCGLALPAGAEGEEPTPAQLYVKLNDGNWSENLNITQGQSVTVLFATENSETAVPITGEIQVSDTAITISGPASEGNSYTLTASSVLEGPYTLSYVQNGTTYSMTVTVTAPTTNTISVPDAATLNSILSEQSAFDAFLTTNHYSGSGDLTLVLPAGDLGSVNCNVTLNNGAGLILKGTSGTKMSSLTIKSDNICVERITFAREGDNNNNISIKIEEECSTNFSISDCTFTGKGYDFRLTQNQNQHVPGISMEGNSFSGGVVKVVLHNNEKNIIGYWNVTTAANPTDVSLTLNATVVNAVDEFNKKYTEIQYSDVNIRSLTEAGWKFYFIPNSTFSTAYAAHEGEQIVGEKLAKYNSENYYKILINDNGKYVIVEDDAPTLKDGKVVISKSQAEHLRKVIVKCTSYKAAEVTFNNSSVPSTMSSDGYLSFTLKTPNGDGTYNVKEVTKTVTKASTTTTTTKRSYNYKYQDYYLITPQRVTDCMRYAKDNLVTIECKEAGRRSISLPVASMAAAAEKGYSILLKNEKIADITLDAAALKSMAQQAKGTTVLLHYRSLNHKTLTTVGLASVQSHLDQFPNDNADLAFLVTATSDSETIEDLQLGTITLKIPFIVLPGTEEMKNEVYALQSETSADARETTVGDGHLTTRLTDLTEHMVFQIGEPVETTEETTEPTVETTVETTQPETVPETTAAPEPVEEEKGFPIWIPIVAVLLLGGGGAAAWFLYLRKRFKK